MAKRLFDIVISSILLCLFSIPMLLISLAVKISSPGKVFFIQKRVGRGCKVFTMYKFRSMHANDTASQGEVDLKGVDIEKLKNLRKAFITTIKGDSRITPIGKVLRKFYLDELPQLLNVFVGDMSLVGPRPDVPVQKVDYSVKQWERRHRVRPGITGLAQIYKGRGGYSAHTRISLDLYYVKKSNLCLDLNILLRTVRHSVLQGSF